MLRKPGGQRIISAAVSTLRVPLAFHVRRLFISLPELPVPVRGDLARVTNLPRQRFLFSLYVPGTAQNVSSCGGSEILRFAGLILLLARVDLKLAAVFAFLRYVSVLLRYVAELSGNVAELSGNVAEKCGTLAGSAGT